MCSLIHHYKPIPSWRELQGVCTKRLINKKKQKCSWSASMENNVNNKNKKKKEWEKSMKTVNVDYDQGRHEVRSEVRGLGKERVSKRYRKKLNEGLGQHDWTVSEVVAQVLKLRPRDDIDDLLNHWAGRFHRKNFPILIQRSQYVEEACWMILGYKSERTYNTEV